MTSVINFGDPSQYQVPYGRVTNITPFTYRDGLTYLELLQRIREWVNGGLVTELNEALKNLAAGYNDAIAKLLADVKKEFGGYSGLPALIDARFAENERAMDERFELFVAEINALVRRKFSEDDVNAFNWITGEPDILSNIIRMFHSEYNDFAWKAVDYSKMNLTVGEIDNLGLSVHDLETESLVLTKYLNPLWHHSPVDGAYKPVEYVIRDVYGATQTGSTVITSIALTQFDATPIRDVDAMLVA